MKYKLLYVGYIDDNITASVHMFSYGIIRELKKLNIELVTFNLCKYDLHDDLNSNEFKQCMDNITSLPKVDFTLCHIYHSEISSMMYNVLKGVTRYDVTVFIETPICRWKFDKYFLYFDSDAYKPWAEKYIIYNAPILKNFYPKIKKEKNSILLDHKWQGHLGTNMEMSDKIIKWMQQLSKKYKIYKLIRWDEEQTPPEYITPIYQTNFQDYLNQILNKEIFISTHYGSYNSTAIDMIAAGSKCIIPKIGGRTFIPQYNIDLFNLPTFSTKKELIAEIKKPLNTKILSKQINKCTDIVNIIKDIDKQFTNIINENFNSNRIL